MSYSLNWNLDSIFSGGSHSDALNQRMKQLEDQMNEYYHRVTKWKYLFSNRTDSRYNLILQFFSNLRTAITSFAIRKLAA